jgi:hypothetical protein
MRTKCFCHYFAAGFAAAIFNSINHLYPDTECGINHVAIRSTLTLGIVALTAARPGLEPATVKIELQPVAITGLISRSFSDDRGSPLPGLTVFDKNPRPGPRKKSIARPMNSGT